MKTEEGSMFAKKEKLNDCFRLVDSFDIVVPKGYDHSIRLDTFRQEHEEEFYFYNQAITDKNFARATVKLVLGQKLKVKVFQSTKRVIADDCLRFLRGEKSLFVGAQGMSLIYEQGKDRLLKDRYAYISFDEKDALHDSDSNLPVLYININETPSFAFDLWHFNGAWNSDFGCIVYILCFCEE